MCVQPIELSVAFFKKLSQLKIKDSIYVDNKIPWIKKFNKIHDRSKHFKSLLSGDRIPSELLVEDLKKDRFLVYGNYSLSDFLDKESVGYELIFDERVSSLTIVTELSFNLDESHIENLFNDVRYDKEKNNLYNTIRNLIVKEDNGSEIGDWFKQVKDHCLSAIDSMINTSGFGSHDKPTIRNNTGNISLLVNGLSDKNRIEYSTRIANSNQMAERVENNKHTLINNDEVQFYFHGRFHTIITSNHDYYYRFFPIQYHAQFMWNSVHTFTSSMDELNRKMLLGEFNNDHDSQLIDKYINKFELVRIHNQDMKMYFESDCELIFVEIERIWTLKESLNEVNNYVSSFKEYIERSYQRKMEKNNLRQNKILFIISCIQTLGLVSIWVDYLSLSKVESFVNTTGFVQNSNREVLLVFNTWFPLILLLSLFILVYHVVFKK